MAKRYDPIMCMMVDEPAKAQDELKIKKEDGLWCVYKDGKVVGQSNSEAGAIRIYNRLESVKDAEKLHYYQHSYTKKWYVVSPDGKVFKEFNTEAEAKNYVNGKAQDSASALDKAIKTCDAVDVDRISNYLWIWVEGREVTSALFNEGLDKYPGPHDKEHKDEAYDFAKKYAQKELDALYSKLKSSVEKKLKEGYANIKNAISSAK